MSKISLRICEVEVFLEGSDDFIATNIDPVIEKCLGVSKKISSLGSMESGNLQDANPVYTSRAAVAPELNQTPRKSNNQPTKKARRHGQPTFLADLNLRPADKQSLRSFYNEKAPTSAQETTTIFVYYLQNILGLEEITLDHIYTCYKDVQIPVPTRLDQNIIDTSNRKGSITKVSSAGGIKMTVSGENFVEFDLPKSKEGVKDGQK